jgi:ribosomal protein S18 acetylase RimI-like enzyme
VTTTRPVGADPATATVGAIPTAVPGLILRPVRWPEEAQAIVDVNNAARLAGGSLFLMSVDVMRNYYDHVVNSVLADDLRLAEVDGRPCGYVRVEWHDENRGGRVHGSALYVTPDAPDGSFAVLLDWIMSRNADVAAAQGQVDRPRVVSVSTIIEPPGAREALEALGFAPVRFSFEMLRPSLEEVPECVLPAGLEVRPVERADVRRIWEAETEAFSGHWGSTADDRSETYWEEFLADPLNAQTDLWQVAWDGDVVAGMVRPFINASENERFGVRRGWCENISTAAAWRGRGVASALIGRALGALREQGMTEAALGVDAQNETGALRLYQRMGFREVARETEWRRPLEVAVPGRGLSDAEGAAR